MATDISQISTEELKRDLESCNEDVIMCKFALVFGLTEYSGGSIERHMLVNIQIRELIMRELDRRASQN